MMIQGSQKFKHRSFLAFFSLRPRSGTMSLLSRSIEYVSHEASQDFVLERTSQAFHTRRYGFLGGIFRDWLPYLLEWMDLICVAPRS